MQTPNFYDGIPTPTPIPPIPTPPYGIEVNLDGFGTTWAYETVQIWNTIPIDYRDAVQIMILFSLFITALILFLRKIRRKEQPENA